MTQVMRTFSLQTRTTSPVVATRLTEDPRFSVLVPNVGHANSNDDSISTSIYYLLPISYLTTPHVWYIQQEHPSIGLRVVTGYEF